MTLSRRMVYQRGWYDRECKINKKKRKREYHRKLRHTQDVSGHKSACTKTNIHWHTVS